MQIKLFLLLLTTFTITCVTESESPKSTKSINNQTLNQTNILRENKDIPQLKIISRAEWQAKEPTGTGKEQTIHFITIHHTAERQKKDVTIEKKMQNLQNFSQSESHLASGKLKPVWFDVPYHFYIAVDGKIAEGRELKFVGDTNTDYDPTGHALIVLEGNFEIEQPSPEQLKSLEEMIVWLSSQYHVATTDIKAHNDYAKTACPGKNLKILLPDLRAKVGEILKKVN